MSKLLLKTIRIKKPSGGTRLQKVKVLASGKYKFVKNTTKGMVRKTRAKGRPAYEKIKKKVKRKSSKPKSKSNKPRKKSDSILKLPKLGKTAKKVAIGLGAAQLAAIVVGFVAPQIVPIAKPIAALAAGGVEGVAAELVLDQGILGNIMGIFNGGGINETRLASGL
jgi:hypothetical protein